MEVDWPEFKYHKYCKFASARSRNKQTDFHLRWAPYRVEEIDQNEEQRGSCRANVSQLRCVFLLVLRFFFVSEWWRYATSDEKVTRDTLCHLPIFCFFCLFVSFRLTSMCVSVSAMCVQSSLFAQSPPYRKSSVPRAQALLNECGTNEIGCTTSHHIQQKIPTKNHLQKIDEASTRYEYLRVYDGLTNQKPMYAIRISKHEMWCDVCRMISNHCVAEAATAAVVLPNAQTHAPYKIPYCDSACVLLISFLSLSLLFQSLPTISFVLRTAVRTTDFAQGW